MYEKSALIVVDMQNDFISGALAVPGAEAIIPIVNALLEPQRFPVVVGLQDWHPWDHSSFKQNGGPWPTHCVCASKGAQISENVLEEEFQAIIRKGYRKDVDSYSGFWENDKKTSTGLDGFLYHLGISDVYICGLALDYCVSWTAEDSALLGYNTHVITDACAVFDLESWKVPEGITWMKSSDL